MRKCKLFGIFPGIIDIRGGEDSECIATDHWLNTWWMQWFFWIIMYMNVFAAFLIGQEFKFWCTIDDYGK